MSRFYHVLILIGALFSAPVYATVLFNNGTTVDASNTTWNDTYSGWTIYDDFELSSDSIVTDINYSIFTNSASNYENTFVTILNAIGGSAVVSTFSIAGSLTSNGLTSNNSNVLNGFDVVLSGLSLNLAAGSYALGISTDMTSSNLVSIGSGDSGFGSALVQNTHQRSEHMAFSIEGTSAMVPEPSTIMLLSLGLLGLGFSKRKSI